MKIGVDLINVSELPDVNSKSESRFFKDNFSNNEIKYAFSKKNTKLVFACIFSIKESIYKCEKRLKGIPFNQIDIFFINNQPKFKNYQISCSTSGKKIVSSIVINPN